MNTDHLEILGTGQRLLSEKGSHQVFGEMQNCSDYLKILIGSNKPLLGHQRGQGHVVDSLCVAIYAVKVIVSSA
jgi:hypothetical protein